MITAKQLKDILYNATDANIEKYLPWLNTFFLRYGIDTPERKAAFIAQIGHESGHLNYVSENLNYSAAGLRSVFGKYFKTDEVAEQYAKKPEKIANLVYSGRMGNGGPETGDGFRYRGRGLLQITGRINYEYMSQYTGIDFMTNPDKLALPEYAVQTACCLWKNKGLNELSDNTDVEAFKRITRIINGGTNGLHDRLELWDRAKDVLINNLTP